MAMRRRFPTILALVAASTFWLQPVLCDLAHAVHDMRSSAEPAGPSHYHDHEHAHHEPGQHTHHDSDALKTPDHSPALEAAHHCCGGHDRPPVVMTPKAVANPELGWVPPAWATPPGVTPAEGASSILCLSPLLPASPIAQGIPCALLCRWLL